MPRQKNVVDIYVGNRLRERRTLAGMSQERLAAAVNLTFQQVQKYEKGLNRMGASRLYQFAKVLDVPPSYFFEGLDEAFDVEGANNVPGLADTPSESDYEAEPVTRETLEFVRYYKSVLHPELRTGLFNLVKTVATWASLQGMGSLDMEARAKRGRPKGSGKKQLADAEAMIAKAISKKRGRPRKNT